MKISTHKINTCMGKLQTPLPFLSQGESDELDAIGYTGKTSAGDRMSREEYLNSLGKGAFQVSRDRSDNGDFQEAFTVVRVVA